MIYIYFMIFVTGGTGLIGAHLLLDLTKKGSRVKALHRKGSNLDEVKKIFSFYTDKSTELFSRIDWIEGDMLDVILLAEAMQGVTEVYHCAALLSMDPADGEKMIHTNVTGTANIVNTALGQKVKKLCYVSSVATLGVEKNNDISEETAWNHESNSSAYTISKFMAENEVWRAAEEGLPVVIVNPSIVIGPGNWNRSSGLIFKASNRGLGWYSSGGMGYVDVRDVVKCMDLLMEKDIMGQRFILSSQNLLFKDFFALVNAALGKPAPNKKAGKLLLELAWRFSRLKSRFTGSAPMITRDIARYATKKLSYSNKKIKKTIEIDFIPVSRSVEDAAKRFISDTKQADF